ncbi:MAG TPA: alcohol dehydrogenase [Azospirillum sp.]|nr:alcohol dehydrogenase [Azospirillum sp.]
MTIQTMRSFKVTAFGQPLEEVVAPLPEPKGAEVLVRVSACGVCHSDLHLWDGHFDLGGGQKMDLSKGLALPRTLGHEIVGTVVAVGPEATEARVGDRRVVYPWIGCGACALCAAGNEQLCSRPRGLGTSLDGGFADHVLVPHERYLIDFDGLREELACTYACSGLTAYSAVKKAGAVTERSPLLIIGAGGVGLAAVRLAHALTGAAPIVAEIDRGKWDAARAAGAGEVMDPSDPDARKALLKATGGVAAAIDFVGAPASFEFGLAALRKGGTLIVVGLFGGATTLSLPLLPLRAVGIVGSYVGTLAEMRELVDLAKAGQVQEIPVQTRSLDGVQQALDDLKGGRVVGRAVIKP